MPLLIISIYKLVFYGLSFFYATALPGLFSQKWHLQNFVWLESPGGHYWKYFLTWDAQHYLHLSQSGYQPGQMSNAFYPLWPLLIRVFSNLSHMPPAVSGLVLANIFSAAGFILFYQFVKDREGEAIGKVSLLLLIAFPGAIFFSLVYTEGLFLFLAVIFLMNLLARRYWAAALASSLMVLTKSVGVFALAPLLASLILNRERVPKWLALLGPLLGLAAYFCIMHLQTGDFLTGVKAQQMFVSYGSVSKWFDLVGFIRAFFYPGIVFHGMLNSFIDRMWFVLFLFSLPFLWRWNRVYFFYALPIGLFPAISMSFMSYTRFISVVIPIFILAAKIIVDARKPVLYVSLLVFLFALQGVFMFFQLNNYWAG